MVTDDFNAIALADLRKRKSEKWTTYPADVLPAFVAEMDFALAPAVRRVLVEAADLGDCGYAGIADLAPAIAEFSRRRFGWEIETGAVTGLPDVMAGVTEALRALTPAGAGVAVNPPVYPPFFEVIRASERTVVEVPLVHARGEWSFDFPALEAAFRAGVKAFLLCSPHNPVGRVWSEEELLGVADLARRYGVVTIADEIHAPLTMPDVPFVPFLKIAPGTQSVALVSASKAWNIAGLKCAAAVSASEEVHSAMQRRMRISPSDVRWRIGHLGALASVAAFRDGIEWLDALRGHLNHNRRLLKTLLDEKLPQLKYRLPEATYLAWIDCEGSGLPENPSKFFLQRGRVALEPGYRFGNPGRTFVRLNFATSAALLEEIVDRMAAAAATL